MMRSDRKQTVLTVSYAGVCLALCLVLPFVTASIPGIGKLLCPMHLPALLCGMLCGPWYGLLVGMVAPVLRSLLFGMPKLFPTAVGMCFELGCYGLVAGLLIRRFPKRVGFLYVTLLLAMLSGRLIGGLFKCVLLFSGVLEKYTLSIFLTGYFVETLPGVVLQLILIVPIVLALRKAKLLA